MAAMLTLYAAINQISQWEYTSFIIKSTLYELNYQLQYC